MTQEQLITKQQIEIEEYKQLLQENNKIKHDLTMMFYAMGQPLNDNILKFNQDQLKWCVKIIELIESINTLKNIAQ